jgi:sulfatase modifying factor 1
VRVGVAALVVSSCSRAPHKAAPVEVTPVTVPPEAALSVLPPPATVPDATATIVDASEEHDERDARLPFVMPVATGPHEWRLIAGKHWQIVAPPGEDTQITDQTENNRGQCGAGMVDVRGNMKKGWLMDERQQDVCKKWITRKFPERCAEFDRDRWLAVTRDLPTEPMHFCIDRFEYPNRRGEFPIIVVNWFEAKQICADSGKRLCTEAEWTFACEGEEATPYPYGYVRDADACVTDHPWIPFDPQALGQRSTDVTKKELGRLWQGVASGDRPRCKSSFGVYDMTGNIDEWTTATSAGRPSILKGGYWGPVRTRCRPSTRAHGEAHVFYQQGLRCCTNPPASSGDAGKPVSMAPEEAGATSSAEAGP